MEYGTQLSFMLSGSALYGHAGLNAHRMLFYHQNMCLGRHHDNDAILALCSPLLDEFRANKSWKWDLRISCFADYKIIIDVVVQNIFSLSLSLAVISTVPNSSNKNSKWQHQRKSRLSLMK